MLILCLQPECSDLEGVLQRGLIHAQVARLLARPHPRPRPRPRADPDAARAPGRPRHWPRVEVEPRPLLAQAPSEETRQEVLQGTEDLAEVILTILMILMMVVSLSTWRSCSLAKFLNKP